MISLRLRAGEGHPPTSRTIEQIAALGMTCEYYPGRGSFVLVEEGSVVIGETTVPLSRDEESALLGYCRKGLTASTLPSRFVQGLCHIDIRNKTVSLWSAESAAQTYFYWVRNGQIVFSSRLPFFRECGVSLELDDKRLPEYLCFRLVVPPNSLCRHIHKLSGGSLVRVRLDSGSVSTPDASKFGAGRGGAVHSESHDLLEGVDSLLRESLGQSLASSRSPRLLLSGGNDSTLLAAVARELDPRVRSISTSFAFVDREEKEEEYAVTAAEHLGIPHEVFRPTAEEYLAGIVDAVAIAGEPVAHLQSVLLYLLFRHVQRESPDLTVCGLVADGLFGDTLHLEVHRNKRLMNMISAIPTGPVRDLLLMPIRKSRKGEFLAYEHGDHLESDRHLLWSIGQYVPFETLREYFAYSPGEILQGRRDCLAPYRSLPLLDQITVVNLLYQSAGTMSIWRSMATAHGNILIYPFADPHVMRFVNRVSWDAKLVSGKHLIRQLLRRYGVPEEIISRPKKSFGFPYQFWALPGTLFQPLVDMAGGEYDPAMLSSLQTGEPGRGMLLWNLLNLYLWRRIVLDGEDPSDIAGEARDRCRQSRMYTRIPIDKAGDDSIFDDSSRLHLPG